MKLTTLEDLFIEDLKDLYDAEQQIIKALPKMVKAATNPSLKRAFEDHLEQSKEHGQRLEQVFAKLGRKAESRKCKAMHGLLEEGSEMIKQNAEDDVKDAGLICAAQKVEHYEMAGYGTVRAYAKLLGHNDIVDLLSQTFDEEEETDDALTELAMNSINLEAVER